MRKISTSGIILLLDILLIACTSPDNLRLEQALQWAGDNRDELEKVLTHYADAPEKLAAARFLIMNMPYHFSQEEYFISSKREKYRPDISKFCDNKAVESHCNSLTRYGYRINREKVYDISSLDCNFLIDNIELAFEVWQKPWAKNISFDDFCKYILPYRAQTEMPSNLRKEMKERFVPILDSAKVQTPLEACCVLNEHLKGIMKYRNTGLPFYPTIEETYKAGVAQCEGICNLGTFIMRACGIPVAVDQTTWTKMDLGHSWCAVLDNNGKFYSFGPGELQPGEHALYFAKQRKLRPVKVYRSCFEPNFSLIEGKDDRYVTYLKSPLIYDVTNEYLNKTTPIQVSVDKENRKPQKSNQVYLCIHNYYAWQPIAIGYRKENICYFDRVVGDNIFMVADSPDGNRLCFITAPFYIDEEGNIRKFIPPKENTQEFTFNKYRKKLDQEHTLHYWEPNKDKFVPLQYISQTDTTQTYDQIPQGALLWYTIPEKIFNQRLLFIKNDSLNTY